MNDPLPIIADRLSRSRRLLFITGAGLSADSGLPTYRGIGGLYDDQKTEDGLPIEVALSGQVFRSRPALTWKYLAQIERACRGAGFNRGHAVIAEMESRFDVLVLTQNVDGLHRAAGSTEVINIHGDVHELRCVACPWRATAKSYDDLPALASTDPTAGDQVPRCPDCGAVIRPDVVLFGEMLDPDRIGRLQREVTRGFDAIFSVGTTSVFPYTAAPFLDGRRRGALTVEINPGPTEVSRAVEHKIAAGAAATLDALWALLKAA